MAASLPARARPGCCCWPGCDCARGVLAAIHAALAAGGAAAEGGDLGELAASVTRPGWARSHS